MEALAFAGLVVQYCCCYPKNMTICKAHLNSIEVRYNQILFYTVKQTQKRRHKNIYHHLLKSFCEAIKDLDNK